ncbi:hypothetical protein PTTG_12425, partial [Puccinia triticina 1-1 BBBD Race 1]
MTLFRACLDLHAGQVKQIVGGSLDLREPDKLKTNFESLPSKRRGCPASTRILAGPDPGRRRDQPGKRTAVDQRRRIKGLSPKVKAIPTPDSSSSGRSRNSRDREGGGNGQRRGRDSSSSSSGHGGARL